MKAEDAGMNTNRYFLQIFIPLVLMNLVVSAGSVKAQPQFKGYVENRLYMTLLNNDFSVSDFGKHVRWGDYNRARVELSKDVSDNSYINITVDHFVYTGYLLQLMRQPDSGGDPVTAAGEQRVSIDRAYIRLYLDNADVTIGKQRISWGQSMLWSPFDVFNRVNFLEPQEEKSGINSFRVSVPLAATASAEAVFAPEATSDESRAGVRFIWNMLGTEFAVTAVHNAVSSVRQRIVGFSFKTDAVIGLWFEGAHFNTDPLPEMTAASDDYVRWLAGFDYSYDFSGKQLYFMAEYTRDEGGVNDKSLYNYIQALATGRSLMGRDYMYGSAQLTLNDYTSVSAGILANLTDSGVMLMPSVRHSLFPNTEMTVGMYTALADSGTEFDPLPENDPFNYIGNSVVYCWFKLFF